MTSEAVARPATAKQMAYIESLRDRLGITQPEIEADDLTCQRAALMISELISQENQQTTKTETSQDSKNQRKVEQGPKIKQARLGLAFKETYRSFDKKGWSPLGPRAGQFAKAVIDLYTRFGEIEQMVAQHQV